MTAPSARNFNTYAAHFPREVQQRLKQMRQAIRKAACPPKPAAAGRRRAPKTEELISYGMPAFKLNGMLVWFAAFKSHIGFYPRVDGIAAFKKELSRYKHAKGSVQFPHDQPLPLALISRIVKFRVQQNLGAGSRRALRQKKAQK